jgi:hypothetical protein
VENLIQSQFIYLKITVNSTEGRLGDPKLHRINESEAQSAMVAGKRLTLDPASEGQSQSRRYQRA